MLCYVVLCCVMLCYVVWDVILAVKINDQCELFGKMYCEFNKLSILHKR